MLEKILAAMRQGEPLAEKQLRQWLDLALVKKMGVLKQSYHCWTSDTKINPSSMELFWGSLLLADDESQAVVLGIMQAEEEERALHQHREPASPMDLANDYALKLLAELPKDLPAKVRAALEVYLT